MTMTEDKNGGSVIELFVDKWIKRGLTPDQIDQFVGKICNCKECARGLHSDIAGILSFYAKEYARLCAIIEKNISYTKGNCCQLTTYGVTEFLERNMEGIHKEYLLILSQKHKKGE